MFRIKENKSAVVSTCLIRSLIMSLRSFEIPLKNEGLALKLIAPYVCYA